MPYNDALILSGAPKPGGVLFRAPLPVASLPSDHTTSLTAAFKHQGYVSEDGVARAIKKAWGDVRDMGGETVKRFRTELTVTFDFALIQAGDPEAVKTVFGDDQVTVTAATTTAGTKIKVAYTGSEPPASAWVAEFKDGASARRLIVPNAQITTESFETVFKAGEAIMFPVTLTAMRDASGVFFYDYSDDGLKSAS